MRLMTPTRFALLVIAAVGLTACEPTIHVKVDPINIYAKLDAQVQIRLDKEVETLIDKNPNLF